MMSSLAQAIDTYDTDEWRFKKELCALQMALVETTYKIDEEKKMREDEERLKREISNQGQD